MKMIEPEKPNGVCFDTDGNVVFRFGNLDTNQKHEVPEYVETERGPEYVNGPGEHPAFEAHPERDNLPDPAEPPTDDTPAPEFNVK